MKFATTKQKIIEYLDYKGIKIKDFFLETGIKRGFLDADKLDGAVSDSFIAKIIAKYSDLNIEWLITGKGEMIKGGTTLDDKPKNLIPFYSDVSSIGGTDVATSGAHKEVEYIDAGDWFPGATSAIRHYGDSMNEYPSGCILALKDVIDLVRGFILGQNYVVEYGEDWNRVTKRVQKKGNTYMAYSTNTETYPDGQLVHQPFELHNIHRAWRVLGYVVKSESSVGVVKVIAK